VQTAPIAPLALAIETPSLAAIDSSWDDLQFTTQATEPSVKHASAPQAPRAAEAEATPAVPVQSAAMQPAAVQPVAPPPVLVAQPAAEPAQPRLERQLLAELQSMRDILREQMATLATKPAPVAARPGGPATRVMTRLLTAGFSADVARRIAANVPNNVNAAQAESWLHEVIAHNVRCAEPADGIVERAGRPGKPGQIFALVGPTGVGKTTTVAKLAARFAVRHGTSALGLITLDAYRVAAPEQLRTYGRILGTPVHLAQDSATLRELLATMTHKRLVLIDTCGLSQRDERLGEMLDLLGGAGVAGRPIQRVLLLNSASHAETLDEAARAWRANECTGAILTKLDEAARIGGSLDASLRHRLTLLGLTNGQRVPEDWHAANSRLLAHLALKPAAQLFELADEEGAALAQAQASALTAHG
jgi:flagellar biosynthesis protein FlhF